MTTFFDKKKEELKNFNPLVFHIVNQAAENAFENFNNRVCTSSYVLRVPFIRKTRINQRTPDVSQLKFSIYDTNAEAYRDNIDLFYNIPIWQKIKQVAFPLEANQTAADFSTQVLQGTITREDEALFINSEFPAQVWALKAINRLNEDFDEEDREYLQEAIRDPFKNIDIMTSARFGALEDLNDCLKGLDNLTPQNLFGFFTRKSINNQHRAAFMSDRQWRPEERERIEFRPNPISQQAQNVSMALLIERLEPAQADQFRKSGFFDVKGQKTGRTYRIHKGTQRNIIIQNWQQPNGICITTRGAFPVGDVMLAQKIALETDEIETLRVANPFFT